MKNFKVKTIAVALMVNSLVIGQFSYANQTPVIESEQQSLKQQLHQVVQSYADLQSFSGTVLVKQGDDIILHKGYGWAIENQWVKNGKLTQFPIGSISKQFAAVSILQLVDQGLLSLDDSLESFIPGFNHGQNISIHHLLSMQSGIVNNSNLPFFQQNRYREIAVADQIAQLVDLPLNFEPGNGFEYSNSNYLLLAHIVEIVSGQDYGAYLDKNVFKPANMKGASLLDSTQYEHYLARGYEIWDGLYEGGQFSKNTALGAGDIQATAKDLFKYEQALEGGKLLSQSSYDLMHTNHINGFGYGVGINTLADDSPYVYFGGGGHPGFTSSHYRIQDSDVSIVVFNNIGNGKASNISYQLLQLMEGGIATSAKPQISLTQEQLEPYVGSYTNQWATNVDLYIEDGELHGVYTNPWGMYYPVWQYVAHSETEFSEQYWGADATFRFDGQGNVLGFGSPQYWFNRVE